MLPPLAIVTLLVPFCNKPLLIVVILPVVKIAVPPPMLPTFALPVPVLNVPATFTPVPVTTSMLALPTALMLTLPFAAGILTLLLPFEILEVLRPVNWLPLPIK